MKLIKDIQSKKKAAMLLLGLIAALFVSFGQVYSVQFPDHDQEVNAAHQSQADDDGQEQQDQEVVKAAYDVISSSVNQLVVSSDQYFHSNFALDKDEVKTSSSEVPHLKLSRYFKVLFRQIISPNAP
ncbi:MAG: hypothetical protein AAFX87_14335 [Bacteroidota bacterium]